LKGSDLDVELTVCKPNSIFVLLPLVKQYHAFEGIDMSDEDRVQALTPLLVDNSLGCILLIHTDGEVVGYLALCFGYSIEFRGRDAFIDEFFIIEPARHRGIGKAALRAAQRYAKELGILALHLEVAHDNTRARRLYESCHFTSRHRFHLMSWRH
jgi:ribosomal protein S18 acetylase RimI-like enzyme